MVPSKGDIIILGNELLLIPGLFYSKITQSGRRRSHIYSPKVLVKDKILKKKKIIYMLRKDGRRNLSSTGKGKEHFPSPIENFISGTIKFIS